MVLQKIIQSSSGLLRSSNLVAVLGVSGSGKSTLLNALNSRYISGVHFSAERYLDGKNISPSELAAISAYCEQENLFIESLTVSEHLGFQTKLRMDPSISSEQRILTVQRSIKDLGI